jgi:hypothetical protein
MEYNFFQQECATAHTDNNSMGVLCNIFGEELIIRTKSYSPDLTPNDYDDYLWGSLKGNIYITIHTQGTTLKK